MQRILYIKEVLYGENRANRRTHFKGDERSA